MKSVIHSNTSNMDQTYQGVFLEQVLLESGEFYECLFIGGKFAGSTFRNCRFVNCTFQSCDLSMFQMPGSLFSNVVFKDSKLMGVNWVQADWAAPRLHGSIHFYDCVINHSTFIGLNLAAVQVVRCTAVDVDFRETDLTRANFDGTDLSGCMFISTNLTEADLSTAKNYLVSPVANEVKHAKFALPAALSLLYSLDIKLVDEVSYHENRGT